MPSGKENDNMALSAFDDKSKKPGAGDLEKMLGRTSAHWDDLKTHIAAEYAPLGGEKGDITDFGGLGNQ